MTAALTERQQAIHERAQALWETLHKIYTDVIESLPKESEK